MKVNFRNIFLIVGIIAIVIMLCTFDMTWQEVIIHVRRAGIWFPAVLILWLFIYFINAWAWYVLIHDGETPKINFWRVYKLTISGYALNSITPVGVLGGEPYRIMELTPLVGGTRASSSVILYSMMHIFSHFCFWAFSIVIFLLIYGTSMTAGMALVIAACTAFCALGFYFFFRGYRDGLALRSLRFFGHWPLIGKAIKRFCEKNEEAIRKVDMQIAQLHAQRRKIFYLSLFLEFAARVIGCLELLFIMWILTDEVTFAQCILMQAFASLLANLMFFIPMQMGTREGSMALFVNSINMNAALGVLTGLITRLREVIWTAIGLALIKIGNGKLPTTEDTKPGNEIQEVIES